MTQKLVCSACGHIGNPKRIARGNGILEIFLWLSLIIPGLFYSVWRRYSKLNTCEKCGSGNLIPLSTHVGGKLLADQGKTLEDFPEPPQYSKGEKVVLGFVAVALVVIVILLNAF